MHLLIAQFQLGDTTLTLIGHVLTLAGIVTGAIIVAWQIARQHRNGLQLQEEHLKNEIRVKLYERLADAVEEASSALSASLSAARRAMMPFELPRPAASRPDRDAAPALSIARDQVSKAVTRLALVMERYEIVFPGFSDVSRAIAEEFKLYLDAHWEFWSRISPFLPLKAENPDEQATVDRVFPRPATMQDIEALKELRRHFEDACWNLEAYTGDVRIESQNVLLGKLFARTLPARKPLDPNAKVLAPGSPDT